MPAVRIVTQEDVPTEPVTLVITIETTGETDKPASQPIPKPVTTKATILPMDDRILLFLSRYVRFFYVAHCMGARGKSERLKLKHP